MSLRIRLTVIITLLFFLSTSIGAGYIVWTAKGKVRSEVQSAGRLASELLDLMINDLSLTSDGGIASAIINELSQLDGIRHLDIRADAAAGDDRESVAGLEAPTTAPGWFVRLVKPPADELLFSLPQPNGTRLLIRTNPNDEIAEVWEETKTSLLLAASIAVLFAAVLYFFIGRWLKPVKNIAAALDAAERGDYSKRLSDPALPELKLIAGRFNQLNTALAQSEAENDQLKQRTIEIQELERRHLAQELHDEMGQSISAIKAIAVALHRHNCDKDLTSAEHASDIERISSHVYDSVRGMMSRLRPAVLDELGLVAALQQMTDDWNDYHRDAFCHFKVVGKTPPLDDRQQINVYRIVQEALTNTAKHAAADKISVALSFDSDRCTVLIEDNGRGFNPETTRKNMGLSGIEERCRALNGSLSIHTGINRGVKLNLEFPI